jgi:hypothetical protein
MTMRYEYRCLPAAVELPQGTTPAEVGAATSRAVVELLTREQGNGFEFVGAYDVATTEKAGCLAALLGPSVIHRKAHVLVFRRPL